MDETKQGPTPVAESKTWPRTAEGLGRYQQWDFNTLTYTLRGNTLRDTEHYNSHNLLYGHNTVVT